MTFDWRALGTVSIFGKCSQCFSLPLEMVASVVVLCTIFSGVTEVHAAGNRMGSIKASPALSPTIGKSRTINFPQQGLGFYSACRDPLFMEVWPPTLNKGEAAKGMVRVPENAEIALATGWGDGASLPLLLNLKPNDIQSLNLEGSLVTDDSFKYICHLNGLKELDLAGSNTSDKNIAMVAKAIPDLQSLNISFTRVSDNCVESLLKMKQLRTLILWKDKITDAGLEKLSKSRSIRFLELRETPTSDLGLKHLSKMNSLSTLNLASTRITDAGLANLESLNGLTMLDLAGNKITDVGLDKLLALPRMTFLNLSNTSVSDRGLAKLCDLKNLRKLWLRDLTGVTDASIPVLAKNSKLEDLEIQKTLITPQGVLTLAKLLPGSEVHSKSPCRCRKRTRVN